MDTNYQAGKAAASDPTNRSMVSMLEGMVDRVGLAQVLNTLAGLCYAKATHVTEAWQDRALADGWSKMGQQLEKAEIRAAKVIA